VRALVEPGHIAILMFTAMGLVARTCDAFFVNAALLLRCAVPIRCVAPIAIRCFYCARRGVGARAGLDGHGSGLRRGKPCVSATAGRLRNSQRRGSAPTPLLLGHPQACLPAAALPQGVP